MINKFYSLRDDTTTNGLIAAYSHNSENALYSVGEGIYVQGFVEMSGYWGEPRSNSEGRPVFTPFIYDYEDISSQNSPLSEIFTQYIAGCEDGTCWAGGDTYFHYLFMFEYDQDLEYDFFI